MLAIARKPSLPLATVQVDHVPQLASKESVKKSVRAIEGLCTAMDALLLKLSASNTPGYLQSVSISASSHVLAGGLRNAASLAATAQSEATRTEARQLFMLCRSQIATRSLRVDARLRELRPHFVHMGVMPFVRRDLRAAFEAAEDFLGAALVNVPDDLRNEALDMVAMVLDSTTTMLSEYDVY